MFKDWTGVMRALAEADEARQVSENDDAARASYHLALERLHGALDRLDRREGLARIAAMIIKSENGGR